jgi:hypothetical protein
MAPTGSEAPHRVDALRDLFIAACASLGDRLTCPELLGQQPPDPAAARTHDRRLICSPRQHNELVINRRHAATGVAVQWAQLGIRSRLGAEGLSFCGSTRRGGSSGTGHEPGLSAWRRRTAPAGGLRGPFAPVPSSCLTAPAEVGTEAQVQERRIETTALLWFGLLY